MQQLNRKSVKPQEILPIRIMQFGGGNFLRAFVDWMVQILNEETNFSAGIAVVKPTKRGNYKQLKAQDGLFTVILKGIKNGKLITDQKLITCVQQVVNPYTDWQDYLDLARNPNLRYIVSNTTEAGIAFSESDIANHVPTEFPGKLTLWLYERYLFFGTEASRYGCVFLPCELIEENGQALRQCVLKYATHWELGEGFAQWIKESNHFCSTLVDRIVSGYPSDSEVQLRADLNYIDSLMVTGEYYHDWVIQGPDFLVNELPSAKTDLNISFLDDLASYREMKVRILNGAHTAMVPIGYLCGFRTVKEVMDHPKLAAFIRALLSDEVKKTLPSTNFDVSAYIADVLDRFRNPALNHKLISIALNSTTKFSTRLLPSLIDFNKYQGTLPRHIAFSLAALICFYKGDVDGDPIPLKDNDKVLLIFKEAWQAFNNKQIDSETLVFSLLGHTIVWGEDLTKIKGLASLVAMDLTDILNLGMIASIEKKTLYKQQ